MLDGVRRNIISRGYRASVAGRVLLAPSPSPLGAAVKQAALPGWGTQPVPVLVPKAAGVAGLVGKGCHHPNQSSSLRPAGSCRQRRDGEPQDGGADAA